jgi:outer membrane murein-binding lipoprotein Lpp
MLWIKRNLFLAVSGLVALALLAGGGYYVYSGWAKNEELSVEVQATRTKLNDIYKLDVFPQTTNIAAAKAEAAKLRAEVAKVQKLFTPVPTERVDNRAFRTMRDTILDELRNLAAKSSVKLPVSEGYAFSFQTQKLRTEFSPDTFPGVPEQMMEIKALCMILFEARVNQISNIRRARVSRDDRSGSNGSDYLDSRVLGNDIIMAAQSAIHPYELTFFSFTSELATVMNGLEKSTHGFVLKALMVEPDVSAPGAGAGLNNPGGVEGVAGVAPPPRPRPPRFPPPGTGQPARPLVPAPGVRPPANDKPVYVLKEKRLKVTMLVYAIKPSK